MGMNAPASTSTLPDRFRPLAAAMPTGRLLTAPGQLAGYESDALGYKRFPLEAVAIPGNAGELKTLVQALRDIAIPFQVRGAGTSLSGGPVAAQGGIMIHTSRLRAIEEINTSEGYAIVECGVVLDQLNDALRPHGLFYPPDPSSGPVCTLGGNVASNAGGAHCFRYGVTGNYVLGMEVLLLDGRVARFGGPAGGRGGSRDDWKRLFVGSEGTLGIFTRFWLRVIPLPEKVWTFRATYLDLEQASEAIRQLSRHPSFPVAIELMDPRSVHMVENSPMAVGLPEGVFLILVEIDGPPALVDGRVDSIVAVLHECGSHDVEFSCEAGERQRLWKARKVQGGLLGQISPDFVVQDAVIPKSGLGEMLRFIYEQADAANIAAVTIMHAGDGNLHPSFLFDSRVEGELHKVESLGKQLMKKVSELGGTLSGEHGIGNDKAPYVAEHFGALGESLQMTIPTVFNPRHQLNPLKVIPGRRFAR